MHDEPIIRTGTPSDNEAIHAIEQSVFKEDPWSLEMISQEISDDPSRITWIMELGELMIGYCMIRSGLGEIHLINMAVEPSFQRMGLGKRMLDHFLDQIPAKSSVFLEVKRGNFPAINLYLGAGFEDVAIHEAYYRDGSDAIVMCLIKE